MIIKILGAGCSKCDKLEKNTKSALKDIGIEASVEKVTDFRKIVKYGVMEVPTLVVDDKIALVGKTASVKEIKKILAKYE